MIALLKNGRSDGERVPVSKEATSFWTHRAEEHARYLFSGAVHEKGARIFLFAPVRRPRSE
jgi:hypothetical protein